MRLLLTSGVLSIAIVLCAVIAFKWIVIVIAIAIAFAIAIRSDDDTFRARAALGTFSNGA